MSDTKATPPVLPVVGFVPPGPLMASVRHAIERELSSTIPPGKRGALLTILNGNGAALEVRAKLDEDGDWHLFAEAGVTWGGDVTGQVVLMGSW